MASLESLGRDETFKSLESLVRLFPKVSQNIIWFLGMFLAGKWFGNTGNSRFWRKLSHKNAIKMVWGVIFNFMPTLTPRLITIIIFLWKFSVCKNSFSQNINFSKKLSHKIAIKMSKGHFSVYLHWNFQVSKVSKVSWDF